MPPSAIASNSSAAIDVRGLIKTYSEGIISRKTFKALKGITLQVQRGEVFGLLGPNGAGKTTLIKTLLGIVRRSSGEAYLLGEVAGSREARRKIGYLPENLSFPTHHSAVRALQFYGRLSQVPEQRIRERSAELLELVGLKGRERELVRKYSKGMRQRLGLAQALLHDPELLILDEPTDGLDPVGRSEIRKLINWLREQGKTVFLNSHILQEVELVCDRVAILAGGQLRGVGTPQELTQQFFAGALTRVRIELSGENSYMGTLRNEIAGEWLELPEGRWMLTANVDAQPGIDALVDRVRAGGASIRHLERTRLTLEEVFLSAVQAEAAS